MTSSLTTAARIVEALPDAAFLADRDGRVVSANAAALAVFGGDPGTPIVGRLCGEFIPDPAVSPSRDTPAVTRSPARPIATTIRQLDGTLLPASVVTSTIELDEDDAATLYLVKRPATGSMEERLTLALQITQTGIFDYDHVTGDTYWSPEQRAIFGAGDGPASLETFMAAVHPDDRARVSARLQKSMDPSGDGSYFDELRILRPDGQVRWISGRARVYFAGEGASRKPIRTIGTAYDITERGRIDTALAESEARLRDLFEHSTVGIYRTTPDGRILMANKATIRMLGYETFEELSTRNLESTGSEPSFVRHEFLRKLEAEGVIVGHEATWVRHDGSRMWVRENARAVRDEQGRIKYYDGTFEDIGDRKRAEEALRHSEARSRAILDAVPDLLFRVTRDGIFLDYHAPAGTVLIVPPESFVGRAISDVMPPQLAHDAMDAIERSIATRTTVTFEYELPTGSELLFYEARVVSVSAAEVLVVSRDVTSARRSDAARERLLAVLDATPDLVAVCDADQRILYLNRAGRRLTGLSDDEDFGGRRLGDASPESARKLLVDTAIPAAIRNGSWQGETSILDEIGTEVPFSQVIVAHRRPDGELAYLSTIARDFSAQKTLEAEFRQAQKMEAVGRLAGGVAHDFNNILGVIIGFAEMAQAELTPDHVVQDWLAQVHQAANRAAELTRQMLAFSRKQVLRPRVVSLNTLIAASETMLRRMVGEDVELVAQTDPHLGSVRVDPTQVDQILMNLAVNARDAMPHGGRLVIETANVMLDEGFTRRHPGSRPGAYVRLRVSDTGVGMDESIRQHVFEPFFSTKAEGKGTGLGLATIYGVVKQSEGFIWVDSEPGKGATFSIYLPQVEGARDRPSTPAAPAALGQGAETILVVEDLRSLREMIDSMLKRQGYTVLTAANGADALDIVRRRDGYPIDLLLTDVVMPGMSGPDLAAQVAVLAPRMATLFMSGYLDGTLAERGIAPGEMRLLQKPFTSASLASAVRRALDERTAPRLVSPDAPEL